MKKNRFKWIAFMLVLSVIISLTGCEKVVLPNGSVDENGNINVIVVPNGDPDPNAAVTPSLVADNNENNSQPAADDTAAATDDEVLERMAALTPFDVTGAMTIGWNLGNTLDATKSNVMVTSKPSKWETGWGNPVTTEELIKTVIDRGFNTIRIPVSWNDHFMPGEGYVVVDSWMDRVQEVVDYAYNNGAYVILDAHHESWHEPYYDNQDAAAEKLAALWTQIAERFADYDEHLIFQGMNEPRKIGTSVEWNGGDKEGQTVVNNLDQVFVDAVRATGGKNQYRMLMVSTYGASGWAGAQKLVIPKDDHLIVSIHAYEPYDFALNVNGTAKWNNNKSGIDSLMRNLDKLFISKGVAVIIDEFGAMTKDDPDNESERAAWAEYYIKAAKSKKIPCVWWDNGCFSGSGELFGIIDRRTYEWKYEQLVDGLFKGLE